MRPYGQTVVAYARANAQIPPLLRDFHMVGSGYDPKDSWKSMMTPKTSEGKPPVGSGARLTYRHYLQDWAFACALELPEGEDIGAALSNPVWPVYLGRKCCPPADYIWRGSFAGIEEALARAEEIAEEKGRKRIFRVNAGATEGDEVMTLNDVPVAFGPYKEYTSRQVTLVRGEAIL